MASHGSFCSAFGCSKSKRKNSEISFFRFPKNKEHDRLVSWINASKREDLYRKAREKNDYLYNNCRLCSDHFSPNMFIDPARKKLIWNAVPFKNPPPCQRKFPTKRKLEDVDEGLERKCKSFKIDHNYSDDVNNKVECLKPQLDVTCLADKIVDLQKKLTLKESVNQPEPTGLKSVEEIVMSAKMLGMSEQCAEFFRGQLHNFQRKSQGRKWTVKDKGVALEVLLRSRQVYELLGNIFLLPSVSTLHKFVRGISVEPGISEGSMEMLVKKVASLPALAEDCVITFDEMSLKKVMES